ncbi:MAG: hypothetical protein KDK65_05975 [Chlamydiia bacterium]|nr:hypothetical protein [Chlamydiia bacterium]
MMRLWLLLLLPGWLSGAYWVLDGDFDLGVGWRRDAFDWNIGMVGGPDVLSELEWKNIDMVQYAARGEVTLLSTFMVRGDAEYGKIFNGVNIDSDYLGKNRTKLFSRSRNAANKGEAFDFSVGGGIQYNLLCGVLSFTPLLGYSYHEQHLRLFRGFQEVRFRVETDGLGEPGELGSFEGLHSNYRTKWWSPWIGLDGHLWVGSYIEVFAGAEYHFSHMSGTGHWNLRKEFVGDFEHDAKGHGLVARAGLTSCFCEGFRAGVRGEWRYFWANNGVEKNLVKLGKETDENWVGPPIICQIRMPLQDVNWHSWRIEAFVGLSF